MTITDDERLNQLLAALALITGHSATEATVTLGNVGIDSQSLVELMAACDTIYGHAVAFEELDIRIETSLSTLHNQIVSLLFRTECHLTPDRDRRE